MSHFLELVAGLPQRRCAAGEVLLRQGEPPGGLFVLLDGGVEILRDDVRVARATEPGAVFGEMSVLLERACTATVRTLAPSTFACVAEPLEFLRRTPVASLHVARLLADRLDGLNRYLVDVKRQYEGHDHLAMVDEVIETLMQRQPRRTPRPN